MCEVNREVHVLAGALYSAPDNCVPSEMHFPGNEKMPLAQQLWALDFSVCLFCFLRFWYVAQSSAEVCRRLAVVNPLVVEDRPPWYNSRKTDQEVWNVRVPPELVREGPGAYVEWSFAI